MRNETIEKLFEAGHLTEKEYYELKNGMSVAYENKEYTTHLRLKEIADKMNSEQFQKEPVLGYSSMAIILHGGMDSIKWLWKNTGVEATHAGIGASPAKQVLMQLAFQIQNGFHSLTE